MEYLLRILKEAGEAEDFNFHPRCFKLKLNHLAFANDLMMFCKGDMQSIKNVSQAVKLFSSSSGLFANNTKSWIYLAGVSNDFRAYAANTLDFAFECLLVQYLSMSVTSKRNTTVGYEYMMDKMSNRIRSWFARKFFYTAQLQLSTRSS
ncbi:uncharacterized protein LOC130821463 [Amaranthus tricolor]|uniref:uncharacterized protein LOC130821463 n=1 Tax=Amaranthus tricolor TaxID=29722 RepID=UPI002582B974|nr:uncharacterized protein LOC130821463 [Amaranthus tricolor]